MSCTWRLKWTRKRQTEAKRRRAAALSVKLSQLALVTAAKLRARSSTSSPSPYLHLPLPSLWQFRMQFNLKKTQRNFTVIVIVFAWLHLIVFCFTLSQTYFECRRPRVGVGRSVPFVTPNVKWGYVFCVSVCVWVEGCRANRVACRRGGKMIYNFIPFDLCTFIEMCWQVTLQSMPDGIME